MWPAYITDSFLNSAKSQNYLAADGQSASLSWHQVTIWDRDKFFFLLHGISLQKFPFCFLLWGALSDEKSGVSATAVVSCSSSYT
jgi:hypothetical protein